MSASPSGKSHAHGGHPGPAHRMNEIFHVVAGRTSELTGTSWAFLTAVSVIVVWGLTGPLFRFSDTWQLVINTGTTIVTFLMVFLIQHTQNRDAKALHLKLDELIRAQSGARNRLIDLEDCTDEELLELQEAFQRLRKEAPEDAEELEAVDEAIAEEESEREGEGRAHAGGKPVASAR